MGMRSSSRPNLVPAKPLCPRNATWRSSFVTKLRSIALKHAYVAEAKARTIASRYRVAMITLAHSLIWPSNNSILNRYRSSFLVSPSLASKPVKHKLSLRSSCLGASAKVSTARLITWRTFLSITVVHLGSSTNVALAVIGATTSRSIS